MGMSIGKKKKLNKYLIFKNKYFDVSVHSRNEAFWTPRNALGTIIIFELFKKFRKL